MLSIIEPVDTGEISNYITNQEYNMLAGTENLAGLLKHKRPKTKMKKIKESDLAKSVLTHLETEGWDCYPEAQMSYGRGRADIACTKEGALWIIEAKLSLSLKLLEQADGWVNTKAAHRVSIAIPYRSISPFVYNLCRDRGVGIIMATKQFRSIYVHKEATELDTRAPKVKKMIDSLHPDMKEYQPGTTSGYSTPYNRTMKAIRLYLTVNPGAFLKDIIKDVPHHYASDRTASTCIPNAVKEFEKGKIQSRKIKGRWRFYPV